MNIRRTLSALWTIVRHRRGISGLSSPLLSDRWLPYLLLVGSLALTYWLWNNHRQDERRVQQLQFQHLVASARAQLDERIDDHKQILRAAAALFSSTDRINHEAWRDYVTGLKLEQGYPAVQAVSFARAVDSGRLPELVSQMRDSSLPDFAVHPAGERDRYVVNVLTEPMPGINRNAIGLDLWHDADQRQTMQRASAAGAPMISGKIGLETDAQGAPVPGFLMVPPVVRKTGEVYGYVHSPFRMPVLIEETLKVLSPSVYLSVHDGTDDSAEHLLYTSAAQERIAAAKFVHREVINVGGRNLSLIHI